MTTKYCHSMPYKAISYSKNTRAVTTHARYQRHQHTAHTARRCCVYLYPSSYASYRASCTSQYAHPLQRLMVSRHRHRGKTQTKGFKYRFLVPEIPDWMDVLFVLCGVHAQGLLHRPTKMISKSRSPTCKSLCTRYITAGRLRRTLARVKVHPIRPLL